MNFAKFLRTSFYKTTPVATSVWLRVAKVAYKNNHSREWNSYNSSVTIFELFFVSIDLPEEFLFRLRITAKFFYCNFI